MKSAGWMPWRQEPTKDGVSTEMPRGVASRHRSVDVRMGKPTAFNRVVSLPEQNRVRKVSEGTETSKYLEEKKSTRDSLSSGERTGSSLNPYNVKPASVVVWGLYGLMRVIAAARRRDEI